MGSFDPLGFTKQTAMILHGLNAAALIPECRRKNISTDVLHKLSIDDLIVLGADSEQAVKIWNTLNVRRRKSHHVKSNIQNRLENLLEVIKCGEQQLSLLEAYIAYCRIRLSKERINTFIEPDQCVTASQALCISVAATLAEVEEMEQSFHSLESLITKVPVQSKRSYRPVCILIGGIGLTMFLLLKIRYC